MKKIDKIRLEMFFKILFGLLIFLIPIFLKTEEQLAFFGLIISLIFGLYLALSAVLIYLTKVDYKCPKCHHVFRPSVKEVFFAFHAATTRRLKCPDCQEKVFCQEMTKEDEQKTDKTV